MKSNLSFYIKMDNGGKLENSISFYEENSTNQPIGRYFDSTVKKKHYSYFINNNIIPI